ncbi:membrane protein [Arthrobacter sp. L77]|uniref:membrane protein n=1 Tax=Arthrobacter sp. L77 TaxID=1496689 RepID=UPI0005B7834C|nr:membrane protein [Arthrobacter sp. L77]
MTQEQPEPPRRVRVTAPRTAARATGASFPVAREMAEQSELGQLFVASLIRSQLRLALVVAGGFLVILMGIPVLLAVFPDIEAMTVLTVPVPWLILGLGVYPLVIGCAVLYVRSASRNERRFQDLVDDD